MQGVNKDILSQEVELWEKQLKILEPLDYNSISKEINSWDISIPDITNFCVLNKKGNWDEKNGDMYDAIVAALYTESEK